MKETSLILRQYAGIYVDDKRLVKLFYIFIPNNWLKMHGYPKRRRQK